VKETTQPMVQRHKPEDLNPEQYCCENLIHVSPPDKDRSHSSYALKRGNFQVLKRQQQFSTTCTLI